MSARSRPAGSNPPRLSRRKRNPERPQHRCPVGAPCSARVEERLSHAPFGFFVAETTDAVYFAVPSVENTKSLALDHREITLVRLPKSEISGVTVGPPMKETGAYRRSLQLAEALCERPKTAADITGETATAQSKVVRAARSQPSASTQTICSLKDIRTLKRLSAHR